jgi:hypothetical protein
MKNFSPAIFKQSSTLLVDDDLFFVENVSNLLPKDTFSKIITQEELDSLHNKDIFFTSGRSIEASHINSIDSINSIFASNLPDDHVVSTLVVDQYMAPKNGLDILSSFKSPFVQKILISNMLTNEEAIQALNEGIINFYLCKMDPHFLNKLAKAIYENQRRFFCNLSMALPNFLSNDNPLMEHETLRVFEQIREDCKVPYYYSNSSLRKFSFTDASLVKKLNLQIMTRDELNEYLGSYQAESVPKEILNLINSEKMLPCFDDSFIPDGENWGDYLQPAQSFQGKQKYLYSIYREQGNAHI